jgi:hypothetical protein
MSIKRRIGAMFAALGIGSVLALGGATPASAATAVISGPTVSTWNRAFYHCNNAVTTGYIGDVTYQGKTGPYISYLRQYHYLQKWNGSSWDTETWHYYNKYLPNNATNYYAPSRFAYDNFYPVDSYGAGYYRISDYFIWYWGSGIRASRTLNTTSCYLS